MSLLAALAITAATTIGAVLGLAAGYTAAYQWSDLEHNTSLLYLAAGTTIGGATLGLLTKIILT